VLYPEELEFHADVAHPDWEVRRVAVPGFRHHELQVVYRLRIGVRPTSPRAMRTTPSASSKWDRIQL